MPRKRRCDLDKERREKEKEKKRRKQEPQKDLLYWGFTSIICFIALFRIDEVERNLISDVMYLILFFGFFIAGFSAIDKLQKLFLSDSERP